MPAWTSDELSKIGNAEELQIQSLRSDGILRKPVTIWGVRIGNDLYVRPVNGREAAWYRGAQTRHEGRIRAGGLEKNVTFVEADSDAAVNDRVDEAYRSKYRRYAANIVGSVLTEKSRAGTIMLLPR